MSNLVFDRFAESVKLMPITRALFHSYYEGEYIIIDNLEAESSYRFSPILRRNHYGSEITLGYQYDVSLYIPHNLYSSNDLLGRLEALNDRQLVVLYIVLGSGGSYHPPQPMPAINYNAKQILIIQGIKVQTEIESVEYRPRCIARVRGTVKNISNKFT